MSQLASLRGDHLVIAAEEAVPSNPSASRIVLHKEAGSQHAACLKEG